ncbi:MAG: hypothetical protein QM639_10200 [Rhodocyclaceae bacterium]
MIGSFDQAAGLRRMFGADQGSALAALTCGAAAARWLARQLHERARIGERLLVLEESSAYGNLADQLGVPTRFDLLQAIEGHVPLASSLVRAESGLTLLPVSRAAQLIGRERMLGQRAVEEVRQLYVGADVTIIHASGHDAASPSSLWRAGCGRLLVVEPRIEAVTQAYATLKKMQATAVTGPMWLAMTGNGSLEGYELVANLQGLAWRQLGIELRRVEHVGQALANPAGAQGDFIDRLRDAAAGLAPRAAATAAWA